MTITTERRIVDSFIGAALVLFGLSYLVRAFGHRDDIAEAFLDALKTAPVAGAPAIETSTEIH